MREHAAFRYLHQSRIGTVANATKARKLAGSGTNPNGWARNVYGSATATSTIAIVVAAKARPALERIGLEVSHYQLCLKALRGQDPAGASAELSPSGKLISLGLAPTR